MTVSKSENFEVEVGSVKKSLYFKRPNQAELFKIDLKYKQIFSEALKAGVMTESQVKKELAKNGSWTPSDDERISKLSLDIANLQAVMNALKDKKEERDGLLKLIGRITELRAELINLISTRTSMFSQSAEGIANEQRMHKFAELCLFDAETNERFFESTSQYQECASNDHALLSEIYKQAYMFEYDIKDIEKVSYPEMEVLKQLAQDEEQESEVKEEQKEEVKVTEPVVVPLPKKKKGK